MTKQKTNAFKLDEQTLNNQLKYLRLHYIKEHYSQVATEGAQRAEPPLQLLARLIDGEYARTRDNRAQRRIKQAKLPLIKNIDDFLWSFPKSINREMILDLFRLEFIEQKQNVILLGGVGVGKTHISLALGRHACLQGHTVLFTTAIDIVNSLSAAQHAGRFKNELRKFTRPALLIIDELGYLPIDKFGADILFQVISQRYEQGSIMLTTNKPFKKWAELFGNDSTLASAVLDRLLHHARPILIEGDSYRMKDRHEKQTT